MKKGSKILLWLIIGIVSIAGTIGFCYYTDWLTKFILEKSTSIQKNFLFLLCWIFFALFVSFLEALLVRKSYRGIGKVFLKSRAEESEILGEKVEEVKETRTMLSIYFLIPLILNTFAADKISNGGVFTNRGIFGKVGTMKTMLRSDDPESRREGIKMSVNSPGEDVGDLIANIIEEGGKLSGDAAWAAGIRQDRRSIKALKKLYLMGNEKQKGIAIVALSELKDYSLVTEAINDLRGRKGPLVHIVVALGNLGCLEAIEEISKIAGEKEKGRLIRASAFWAISMIEQERFRRAWFEDSSKPGFDPKKWVPPRRQGWEPLIDALSDKDRVLQCGAVQSLRYAGPIETSRKLMEFFESIDRFAKCDELKFEAYPLKIFFLVSAGLLRTHILKALSGIGDRGIVSWLEKIAEDKSNADEVIVIAKDLANQIKGLSKKR